MENKGVYKQRAECVVRYRAVVNLLSVGIRAQQGRRHILDRRKRQEPVHAVPRSRIRTASPVFVLRSSLGRQQLTAEHRCLPRTNPRNRGSDSHGWMRHHLTEEYWS